MGRARLGTLYRKLPSSPKWTGAFTHPISGKRIIRLLYADKQASRAALDRLVRDAERCAEGLEDPHGEQRCRPLTEHVVDYIEACQHERQAPRHVKIKESQLQALVKHSNAARIDEITLEVAEKFLRSLVARTVSARTHNHYRATLVAFMNWAVRSERIASHALARLPKLDERVDRRRTRRALTEAELVRLLRVARWRPIAEYGRAVVRQSPEDRRGRKTWTRAPLELEKLDEAVARGRAALSRHSSALARLDRRGRERELIYKTLVLTGLRKGELASLTVGDLRLDHAPPYAVLRAWADKARLGAEIPLRPDLAADLRRWLAAELECLRATVAEGGLPIPVRLPAERKVFAVPYNFAPVLHRDLRAAGIPKRDDRGFVVDVHALRHTFGTHLAKSVLPRTAQAAMRHSTIQLTMNLYTDPRLLDVASALDALPSLRARADLPLRGA